MGLVFDNVRVRTVLSPLSVTPTFKWPSRDEETKALPYTVSSPIEQMGDLTKSKFWPREGKHVILFPLFSPFFIFIIVEVSERPVVPTTDRLRKRKLSDVKLEPGTSEPKSKLQKVKREKKKEKHKEGKKKHKKKKRKEKGKEKENDKRKKKKKIAKDKKESTGPRKVWGIIKPTATDLTKYWAYMKPRPISSVQIGSPTGIPVGTIFMSRKEASESGIHR